MTKFDRHILVSRVVTGCIQSHILISQMKLPLLEVKCELIGELIAEYKGKNTGTRVLADGKLETSSVGTGTLLGKEASLLNTAVATPMPNGVSMLEGNGIIRTTDGESAMHKSNGIGWYTGKGLKLSLRGTVYFMTNSPSLASLNKTVGIWELEQDEQGEFSLRVWAWK